MLISLAERAAQHVEHARDQPVDVEPCRLERLAAGEGEQPLRELRRALGALHGGVDRLSSAWRAARRRSPVLARSAKPPPHRVEIADDDGEQIVEVVRDAAGELAHGLHLLRLAQRRLGLLAQPRLGLELLGARDEIPDGLRVAAASRPASSTAASSAKPIKKASRYRSCLASACRSASCLALALDQLSFLRGCR